MDTNISASECYQKAYEALMPSIQDERECKSIVQHLLYYHFELSLVDKIVDRHIVLTASQLKRFEQDLARLRNQEPIQYVLGQALFYGLQLQVNPQVLIPRPETEEMVRDIIRSQPPEDAYMLDLCTGSGCIAIALKHHFPNASVFGVDIQSAALDVARANAVQLALSIQWLQLDVLQDHLPNQQFQLIVSNPPYVCPSEKKVMHQRVLGYEPAKALFVPESTPLIFHERIVALALKHLVSGGRLYLEINERYGREVALLFEKAGFQHVCIKKDIHDRERWVSGIL